MAWSTRELADLAGTTLRAVRHYHQVGLLDEPERSANGYKQYGVEHLTRVLRIRRLVELGMSLDDIHTLDDSLEPDPEGLRTLDAEIGAAIDRLVALREELVRRAEAAVPSELPTELGFISTDARIPEHDRHLVLVLSRVLDADTIAVLAASLREPRHPVEDVFDALPADASEVERESVAEALLEPSLRLRAKHPGLPDLFSPELRTHRVIQAALREIYNPAQVDVYRRLSAKRRARDVGEVGRSSRVVTS